jgi:membrane protein YqaA with SNARE-associated domain
VTSFEVRVRLLERWNEFLLVLGIPGLFILALVDSAAIPIAGGPDAIVLLLAWQRPDHIWLIVASAVAGSTLGCLVLYRIGRAGGELALARFSQARQAWIREKLHSHAFWTILISELIPPPFPTKPVILAAGVFQMPVDRFSIGILIGRSIRYLTGAYLGAHFGQQASSIIGTRFTFILLATAAAVLLVVVICRLRRKFA